MSEQVKWRTLCLRDRTECDHRFAAAELGDLGKKARSALPTLFWAIVHREDDCDRYLAQGLGRVAKFYPDEVLKIVKLLRHKRAEVRCGAAYALHETGKRGKPAVSALIDALDDPDEEVVDAAFWALSQIGERCVVPHVVPFLWSSKSDWRSSSLHCLKQICRWSRQFSQCISEFLEDAEYREKLRREFTRITANPRNVAKILVHCRTTDGKEV